jgi:hypothetical protein
MARHRDLTALRYDYPLVLAQGDDPIRSLTALVNEALAAAAPAGDEGEATRRRVLQLERAIRAAVAQGATGTLTALWDAAAAKLGAGKDAALAADFKRVRAALPVDGDVIDCTPDIASRLAAHAWRQVERRKAERFDHELERLAIKVADILRADFTRSKAGTTAERLKASVGSGMESMFDFQALSSTLGHVIGRHTLTEAQRQRLQAAQATIEAYRTRAGSGRDPSARIFSNCRDALAAFHDRTPDIVDVVKSMAIAELEIEGAYVDASHDSFFAAFDEGSVAPKDLALFPDFLVSLDSESLREPENAALTEILASDMPIKVVLRVGDVLDEDALHAHLGFVAAAATLGRMAAGLGTVYVLQTTASDLYRARRDLAAGLSCRGPALLSIYSASAPTLPPYLVSAAALQGRAFPAFRHDPSADESSRLVVAGNPQPAANWPLDGIDYEDGDHQRAAVECAFTFADFVACDPRHAGHFALVPKEDWNDSMVPAAEFIAGDTAVNAGHVPYIWVVDEDNALHRAIVDESLVTAARRCLETWHGLQALGGVRSTAVERLIAREREAWEAEKAVEIEALQRAVSAAPAPSASVAASSAPAAAPAAAAAAAPAAAAEPEQKSDDPYIETVRCTTCNECTTLNDRMFAYDGNKQAFIKDPTAGTYKQLVEAAESCQVSIIHPGKPKNPNEPGLAELMKRAEAFL